MKRTKGLALIVIDYLQLMRPAAGTKPENRVLEISQITQGLKAIAKELEVPVLALSQLSRQVENREDKRPQLADLRESGHDRAGCGFGNVRLSRRVLSGAAGAEGDRGSTGDDKFHAAMDKWKQEMERAHNKADLIIAKQRHGPTGSHPVVLRGRSSRGSPISTWCTRSMAGNTGPCRQRLLRHTPRRHVDFRHGRA